MSPEESEASLERFFLSQAKRGVILSSNKLAEYARRKGLPHDEAELRSMRHRFKFSAYASKYVRPPHYFSPSIWRYGIVQIDLAEFEVSHKRENGGCGAFLLASEMISQQIAIVACRDKGTKSWEGAVTTMAETRFPAVRYFVSDRESALTSRHFQKRIREKFNIRWTHLKSRNKVSAAASAPPTP